ncbi:hypothetical protein N658DRAFT_492901 [Parathielavia hyrcaniae]|uniref:Uncharacterized protein n=1 Tax=Parathielavia hyrcaniae TaxID=113614 RepID=A0AAN6Q759_9PEZI|nr:hypothetical protein N658DRAFT_492901 [Parathielavia hyrcaniae]
MHALRSLPCATGVASEITSSWASHRSVGLSLPATWMSWWLFPPPPPALGKSVVAWDVPAQQTPQLPSPSLLPDTSASGLDRPARNVVTSEARAPPYTAHYQAANPVRAPLPAGHSRHR